MKDKFKGILSVKFENYKCIEDFTLDCRKPNGEPYQWTILLGDNNTGKTNLLRAISLLAPVEEIRKQNDKPTKGYTPKGISLNTKSYFIKGNTIKSTHISSILKGNYRWEYGYTRNSTGEIEIRLVQDNEKILDLRIFGYGVTRYPDSTRLTQNSCEDCETLFDTSKRLTNLEEWLLQLDYASKNKQEKARVQLNKIKELLCGEVFPEIIDFRFESSENLESYVLFETKDGWFRYTDLGFGYQSTLAWIVDLCRRMFEMYPESKDPLKEFAVVLVDEIDLHLHPQWQRELVGDLGKFFPNIQFIVTTHSPAVVQSMTEVNLYTLSRNSEGRVTATRSERTDFSGLTVEEILRETMGLGDGVHSIKYNEQIQLFGEALDEDDKKKAREAYDTLDKMLHIDNPIRRMLRLQLKSLEAND